MESPQGLEKFQPSNREECGIIIKASDRTYVVKVPNHAKGNSDYAITLKDMQSIQNVLSDDEQIVGFFHTHLAHHDCEPTDADFDGSEAFPEFTNMIYKPDTGETSWYGALKEVDV